MRRSSTGGGRGIAGTSSIWSWHISGAAQSQEELTDAVAVATYQQTVLGISRQRLFFWVFLTLAANSVAGLIIRSLAESGIAGSTLSTFGVSVIVWTALVAGLALLMPQDGQDATPVDMTVALGASLLALVPIANISSVGLTGFAVYAIWSSDVGNAVRRAGAIFLAVTANLIWGRLLLGLFSRELLFIDAFFVSHLAGSVQVGNIIPFKDFPGFIIVAPGCSSLQGISLAIVFWAMINQWFGMRTTLLSLMWCGFALLAAFAINIIRLSALIHFPLYFDEIHVGWGAQLTSIATMLAIVGVVLWGARREVFR